jgi:hypothetical protein
MSTNQDYKKPQRKADLNQKPRLNRHGRQPHQKLKPYIVFQYLLKYTDEDNVVDAFDIISYLSDCGINADRRSIYRDIEEINRIMYMIEYDCTIAEALEVFPEEKDEDFDSEQAEAEKVVVYDKNRKGFYVRQRHYDVEDIRLLAECIYSAKFLSEGQAKRLADVVCGFVSDYQAETIRYDALLTDRVKTSNKSVISNISTINAAMSKTLEGEKHIPEKISFKYLKASVSNVTQQVERRKGERYTVSPYKLLINDGNYYLLSFDDKYKKMRTYRVDRMRDVRLTGQPRDGVAEFAEIDLRDYTKRTFSMFGGKTERVEMRFINPLLDTAIDRFGTTDVRYSVVDETHFSVTANVDVSDQFFGWLLGFGKRVKLLGPPSVIEKFRSYMDKVREMYL